MPNMRRIVVFLLVAAACVGAGLALRPGPQHTRAASTLTVVGTSDVSDSNLMQSVIQPGFEAAYPQYALSYVSKGTGAAIAYAEAGTASALLVHAASLENRFVGAGYSTELHGRAIFYGDYVLLGPDSDPAGVLAHDPHDIVGAFARLASAGTAGRATFVSRGGTPGTTVQEHAIWKLVTGVAGCAVSAANGGGLSPSSASGVCPPAISYPAWYQATGLTQAPNVVKADTCAFQGGGCYVFTDRGTYDYLRSTKAVGDLKVVSSINSPSAPGGANLLVNSFHAYGVNPAKFDRRTAALLNPAGANAFLSWITSPAAQAAVSRYLTSDGSAPFHGDAAPTLTAAPIPHDVAAGSPLSITGALANAAPGTPALAHQTVTLLAQAPHSTTFQPVATTTTDARGHFALRYTPTASATYRLQTPQLTQTEKADLSPAFGDLLAATTTELGQIDVAGSPGPGSS